MALSQLQCLDDNHVNLRTTESKPEFLYCEEQRLGLETLLAEGREAFAKFLEARGLRGFLSDLELDALTRESEPFDPDAELYPEGADEDEPPLSQDYWPELSDQAMPELDLGWPDSESYRGVTRTSVYSQPPAEGQAHIKEVVRKMIAQAQKMIAVVMDVFTDVDIFRDLLDISFKKKVSVYILVEQKTLPHFLSMCHRADMHAGHLKHLRVRCTGGREFYTRSCTKVSGQLGHRFMLIDGDKALSGSYSFTWTSSRLDRNLITVVTGQTVETFDRLFQCLYMMSSYVELKQAASKPEPAPEPIPQRAPAPPLSATIARKLHNPKYSLVIGSTPPPANLNTAEQTKTNSLKSGLKKGRQKRGHELPAEAPPLHPGLVNLEKAHLVEYLPTWPEPDPASDVIGFINIVDTSRPNHVHLQRSERFGVSQAIKFSSPMSEAKAQDTKVKDQNQPSPLKSAQATGVKQGEPPKDDGVKNTAQSSGVEVKVESDTETKPVKGQSLETHVSAGKGGPAVARPLEGNTGVSPESDTPPKPAPTDSTKQPTLHRETSKLGATLTTQNDSTDDGISKEVSSSPSQEQDSPSQPSEMATPPPDKTGRINPSSTLPTITTPPIPKPRTVHLRVEDAATNGGSEKLDTGVPLKSKPESEVRHSAGNDSSTLPDTGQRDTKTERPKDNNHPAGKTNRDSQEERSLMGVRGDGTVMHNGLKESHDNPGEVGPETPSTKALVSETEHAHDKSNQSADKGLTQGQAAVQTPAQLRTYHAKSSQPQVISYGGENAKQSSSSRSVDFKTSPSPSIEQSRPTSTETTPVVNEDPESKVALTTQTSSENSQKEVNHEVSGRPQQLTIAQVPNPSSSTPERSQYTFRRISTPDGSRTPTPDSQTTTPDSGPFKPGLRSPTPVSDGYVSSKEDSTLSTTSDEYYECSDSLFNEWFFDRNVHRGHAPKDDQTDASAASPIYMNCNSLMTVSPVLERQEKTLNSEKRGDLSLRKRGPEASSTNSDGKTSPNVLQGPPQLPMKKRLPSSSPEMKTQTSTGGVNTRKLSSGVEWEVLTPKSTEKSRPESEGKQAEQDKDQNPRTPRAQPQNHPVDLRNSTPPARPPPPRIEGTRDTQNQNKPAPLATQEVTRVKPPQEKHTSPLSFGPFLRSNLQSAKTQAKSEGEEQKNEEGRDPFSVALGKLQKIANLKEKKGRKSTSSPADGRKGTS